jgi:MFS family permease
LLLGVRLGGNAYLWGSPQVIGLFLIFIVSLTLFIIIENRVESPVVPLGLFKNKIVSVSNIASFLSGLGMFGAIMYVPFYIQGVLGRSATLSGLTEMTMTISMVIFSAIAGQLITKTGKYKAMGLVGFAILSLGLFLNSLLTPESSLLTMVLNLIICGIGLGLTMPIFTLTVQNAVDHKYLGVATATSQLSRQMGGTVGVAILGAVLNSRMTAELKKINLPPELTSGTGAELSDFQNPSLLMDPNAIEMIKKQLPDHMHSMLEQLLQVLQNALNVSLTGVFLFASIAVALALVTTLFLKEIPLRESNEPTKSLDE